MALTAPQLATLKADILSKPALSSQPMNSDGDSNIAKYYNGQAAPNFTVWKTNVTTTQVGDNIVATELAGMTSLNLQRLQNIVTISTDGINASLPDRRAFFDDIFSGAGGAVTRPKLLALWKRFATEGEKLYATGTGSDATPATMTFEGSISYQDVSTARGS